MLLEEGRCPRQARLAEEEEEEDEVSGNSWGGIQELAGKAQVQGWAMGCRGLSAWLAWRD